jgi:hypothetical protein
MRRDWLALCSKTFGLQRRGDHGPDPCLARQFLARGSGVDPLEKGIPKPEQNGCFSSILGLAGRPSNELHGLFPRASDVCSRLCPVVNLVIKITIFMINMVAILICVFKEDQLLPGKNSSFI